jgi:hypothetical protein
MYPEPIEPATADKPAEALRLVCEALSDGDLEAAVALYEPGAAWPPCRLYERPPDRGGASCLQEP